MATLMKLLVEIGADTKGAITGVKQVETGVKKFQTSALTAAKNTGIAFASIGAAAIIVKQAWEATGGVFVAYAEQVKNLSRNIGVSSEEASRLIQVADDVRISYDSMSTAMKIAQKQGVDVSTEGLAKLADEYKALAPGVERTKFLVDKFGRSGLEMGKLLERGGDGVRKMSDSIDNSLVLTAEAIRKSDEYQKKLDDLEDSVLALQVAIGEKLVPAMTDAATIANANVTAFTSFGDVLSGKVALNDWAAGIINANNVFEETGTITEENTVALEDNADALDGQKAAVKAAEDALNSYKDMLDQVSQANQDAESFIQSYADFQKGYDKDHADALKDVADAEEKLRDAMSKKAKTPEQKDAKREAIDDAKTGLLEAGKAVQDLEATWHESTQKMIYDMILAKVSVDGLTNAEFKATQDLAVQMGIRTQAQADEAKGMMDKAQIGADGIALQEDVMAEKKATDADLLELENQRAFAAGETTSTVVGGAAQQAAAIQQVIAKTDSAILSMIRYGEAAQRALGMAGGVRQTSTAAWQNGSQRPFTPTVGTRALGGSVFAGTPYTVGEHGMETFVPRTNGTIIPAGKSGGKVQNITVNIQNPKREAAEEDIRKAMKNLNYLGVIE